ncbi:helix-turn-helix domain-containing protein [Gluconobacter cerinus]|uniref:helix-turn-helix domain-containing protein n=1 Tax=Gluconobacter cerinus TaxID=38307 RepID=UPI001B8D7255|nr:helix-turn-helix transcriptional regulator [Gluconobacter cerinus]MBS1068823.1 helix-turn-helix transcriptional regulator [Gluconobacter cerinus]
MENTSRISDRIKSLRKRLNMKQADFVAGLNISRSYLSKLETGEEQPGRDLLIRMSHEFNVSLDWLTSGSGDAVPARAINEQEALLLIAFRSLPPDEAETHLKLMLQRSNKDRIDQ